MDTIARGRAEDAFKNGGSVMFRDGRIVTRMEDMPPGSIAAPADPSARAAAAREARAKIDRLQAELDTLEPGATEAE